MNLVATIAGALGAAFAMWLSTATLGFTGADGVRLAILPLTLPVLLLALAAAVAVAALRRVGASLRPLALLAFLLLPWLPLSVPAAFLLWVRPLSLFFWIAVLMLMVASLPRRPPRSRLATRRAAATAGAIAAGDFRRCRHGGAAPMIPGGDEPHYLIITQSLLIDHALTIDDVHRRGDYRAYYGGELQPHVQMRGQERPDLFGARPGSAGAGRAGVRARRLSRRSCVPRPARRGRLRAGVARRLARRPAAPMPPGSDGPRSRCRSTAIFQSFTVYPGRPGRRAGADRDVGAAARRRRVQERRDAAAAVAAPWRGAGAAAVAAFAVRGAGRRLGALVLLRLASTKNPAGKAVAFLSIPAISAVLWVGYFVAIYGRPDPIRAVRAGGDRILPLRSRRARRPAVRSAVRTGHLCAGDGGRASSGLAVDARRGRESRRLALELLFVVDALSADRHALRDVVGRLEPAGAVLRAGPAALRGPRGRAPGRSPAHRATPGARVGLAGLDRICASAIVVVVDRGRLAFNTRDAPSLWFEWIGRLADLTAATPMWARDTDVPLFRAIAIWMACRGGRLARASARSTGRPATRRRQLPRGCGRRARARRDVRRRPSCGRSRAPTAGRASPSQLQLLETVASAASRGRVSARPVRAVPLADVPARLRIELSRAAAPAAGRRARRRRCSRCRRCRPARYRCRRCRDDPRGWLMVGIARDPRDPFALRTVQLPVPPIELQFPCRCARWSSAATKMPGEPCAAWSSSRSPSRRAAERLTADMARRAVRYGGATVYFLDDRSFPEPQAFWVGGARDATVVLQPDTAAATVTLCCATRRSTTASCCRPGPGRESPDDGAGRGAAGRGAGRRRPAAPACCGSRPARRIPSVGTRPGQPRSAVPGRVGQSRG